jgi:hypothetical protein
MTPSSRPLAHGIKVEWLEKNVLLPLEHLHLPEYFGAIVQIRLVGEQTSVSLLHVAEAFENATCARIY